MSTEHFTSQVKSNRPWLGVFSLTLGTFAAVTTEFIPVGILPEVATDFGITAGKAGLMMSMPGVLAALSALFAMIAAGKTDRRTILLSLSFIQLLSSVVAYFAPNYMVMLLSRALVGIALGGFWAMALATAGRLVRPEKVPKAAAGVFAGVTTAMIIGVPLGTFIAGMSTWRDAFLVTGAVAAAAFIMQMLYLPSLPASTALKFGSLVNFCKSKAARKSIGMVACIFAAHFGTYTYVSPLMKEAGFNEYSITLILLTYGLIGFISNFVITVAISKNLKISLVMMNLLMIITLSFLPLVSMFQPLIIVLIIVWGAAWGALPLCTNTWHRSISGDDMEPSSAMYTFTNQVAIASGAAIGGIVVDHVGLSANFVLGAVVALLGTFFVLGRKDVV